MDELALLRKAKVKHDKACSCDERYLMSCPKMAQAILDAGEEIREYNKK